MNQGKPSDVVYFFLNSIAQTTINLAHLIGRARSWLWMAGMYLINLSSGSSSSKSKDR